MKSFINFLLITALSPFIYAQTQNNETSQQAEPYIEIEKYDTAASTLQFKEKNTDKINVYSLFRMNSMTAKNRTSFQSFNLSTSTETEIGAEYSRYLTEANRLFLRLAVNRFSMADVTSLTPAIEASNQTQASATIGGQYLFTESNYIGYGAHYKPHYYLIEKANSALELDYASSTSVFLETENQFYTAPDYIIAAQFGVEYITNAKISGNELGFDFGLIYQQEFKAGDKLRVKANYAQTTLDTLNYSLQNNSVALNFMYSLPF